MVIVIIFNMPMVLIVPDCVRWAANFIKTFFDDVLGSFIDILTLAKSNSPEVFQRHGTQVIVSVIRRRTEE
jgi:hypothetical protein